MLGRAPTFLPDLSQFEPFVDVDTDCYYIQPTHTINTLHRQRLLTRYPTGPRFPLKQIYLHATALQQGFKDRTQDRVVKWQRDGLTHLLRILGKHVGLDSSEKWRHRGGESQKGKQVRLKRIELPSNRAT